MSSGWINDEVRTIIPSWARAEIDVRLVKESNPRRLLSLIKKHIEGLGYLVLDREPNKKERLKHKKIATLPLKFHISRLELVLKMNTVFGLEMYKEVWRRTYSDKDEWRLNTNFSIC